MPCYLEKLDDNGLSIYQYSVTFAKRELMNILWFRLQYHLCKIHAIPFFISAGAWLYVPIKMTIQQK